PPRAPLPPVPDIPALPAEPPLAPPLPAVPLVDPLEPPVSALSAEPPSPASASPASPPLRPAPPALPPLPLPPVPVLDPPAPAPPLGFGSSAPQPATRDAPETATNHANASKRTLMTTELVKLAFRVQMRSLPRCRFFGEDRRLGWRHLARSGGRAGGDTLEDEVDARE